MTSPILRLLVLGTGLSLLAACGGNAQQQQQQQPPPPEVGVIQATPQTVPLTREVVGRLSAYRSADVRARVPGVLLKRTYEEGTDVEKGQSLFQIDPAPLRATLSSAQAQLAQAQATYTNNHVAAERARQLGPKGFISKSDVDSAEAAERTAAAAVKAARASVESAQINLGYADVRAPIAGRAGKQQVTEGALVGQGEATLLTRVDQIDSLYANFTMGVSDMDELRQAQAKGSADLFGKGKGSVRLTLPDGSAYGTPGTLDFSGTTVDPQTGAVSLRASIPNPEHALLPGMYASMKVTLGQLRGAYPIPEAAVQRDTRGPYVLTVGKDGKVAHTSITTSGNENGNWIVTGGLSQGQKVVVSGIPKAKEGQPAKPVAWTPESSQPAKAASGGKPSAAGPAGAASATAPQGAESKQKH